MTPGDHILFDQKIPPIKLERNSQKMDLIMGSKWGQITSDGFQQFSLGTPNDLRTKMSKILKKLFKHILR